MPKKKVKKKTQPPKKRRMPKIPPALPKALELPKEAVEALQPSLPDRDDYADDPDYNDEGYF